MLERFREELDRLCCPCERLVVGYSGGADSTCLLHLCRRAGVEVIAAHLHHGMRPEADEEMERCRAFAESLGFAFVGERADVPGYAALHRLGLEEAGRHCRRRFLTSLLQGHNQSWILLAHTADDQLETVLMNLTKGAGLRGMGGIRPFQDDWQFFRPLLWATRAQTRAYCEEHGLWFHDDPANDDLANQRVRIRKQVVPELERLNPEVHHAAARQAELAREVDDWLNEEAWRFIERWRRKPNRHLHFLTRHVEEAIDRAGWEALDGRAADQVLRTMAACFRTELTFQQTRDLRDLIRTKRTGTRTLSATTEARWDETTILIGETERPGGGHSGGHFEIAPGSTFEVVRCLANLQLQTAEPKNFLREPDSLDALFDLGKTSGPLIMRSAETGDRMQPLGLAGTKLISDLYQEARLTLTARRLLPMLCDTLGIIWIPGVALADRVRIDAGTKRALHARFGPIEESQ